MADVALFEYDKEFVGKKIEPSPLMMPVRQSLRSCFDLFEMFFEVKNTSFSQIFKQTNQNSF